MGSKSAPFLAPFPVGGVHNWKKIVTSLSTFKIDPNATTTLSSNHVHRQTQINTNTHTVRHSTTHLPTDAHTV